METPALKTGVRRCGKSTLLELMAEHLREQGVEKVTYRLAKKDKTGEPTSELQERTYSKTLYDSSKISTDEYIRRGMETAANAKSTSGTQWEGLDSGGARWIGYKNGNGEITTFFPAD